MVTMVRGLPSHPRLETEFAGARQARMPQRKQRAPTLDQLLPHAGMVSLLQTVLQLYAAHALRLLGDTGGAGGSAFNALMDAGVPGWQEALSSMAALGQPRCAGSACMQAEAPGLWRPAHPRHEGLVLRPTHPSLPSSTTARSAELLAVIQERMEFVACQVPAGSAAQRVMAEFVSELRERILKTLPAEVQD